jgi:hypothetical protein
VVVRAVVAVDGDGELAGRRTGPGKTTRPEAGGWRGQAYAFGRRSLDPMDGAGAGEDGLEAGQFVSGKRRGGEGGEADEAEWEAGAGQAVAGAIGAYEGAL